jgi:SH3-like domain-containing protein
MGARWLFVQSFTLLSLTGVVCLAPVAYGQETPATEVENSKYQFAGTVNSSAVYVRSGPSENDYAVMKLDKGAELTVVGIRFEWLKVLPPQGSFCYVAKAYVEKRGDGTIGRVTNPLYVRVGSELNSLKAKVAMKLDPNQDVNIIGEQDEYFKIVPPQGVYMYVNRQFVDPVRKITAPAPVVEQTPAAAPTPEVTTPTPAPLEAAAPATQSTGQQAIAVTPTTTPTETQTPEIAIATPATLPATQPTASAEPVAPAVPTETDGQMFDRLEDEYAASASQSLEDQNISEMLSGYQKLASSNQLPESMRRMAEAKAKVLQLRSEAQQELVAVQKSQEELKTKQMALKAEHEEITDRIAKNDVHFYTAVGTLRPSSLQQGKTTLYRLTDPANGRTVVYIRSSDNKLGSQVGQFVGVRGEISSDSELSLRVISPTLIEPVDQNNIFKSVASQIVPPSLIPSGQANTNTAGE